MEFQFGDFGGTLAMFVQAVSRQEPFSRKESLRYYGGYFSQHFFLLGKCGFYLKSKLNKLYSFNSTDKLFFFYTFDLKISINFLNSLVSNSHVSKSVVRFQLLSIDYLSSITLVFFTNFKMFDLDFKIFLTFAVYFC